MFLPLSQRLAPGSSGLDFGSGPAPTLSLLFEEAGHAMNNYDFWYQPDPAVFSLRYDFITATEVVEHLRDPRKELERLWQCLKPGGTLGIMTKFRVGQDAFPHWHYKNDLTHVCFFSESTFDWLAGAWNAEMTIPEDDVVLFKKNLADL